MEVTVSWMIRTSLYPIPKAAPLILSLDGSNIFNASGPVFYTRLEAIRIFAITRLKLLHSASMLKGALFAHVISLEFPSFIFLISA